MTTLEQAARQALEALEKTGIEGTGEMHDAAITALRQALEQASVETYIHEFRILPHPGDFGIPKGHWWQAKAYAYHHADQLCAFTPKREWVSLTDDEIFNIYCESDSNINTSNINLCIFARAIEAKLKESNT